MSEATSATIYAPGAGIGKAAIAIVRLSGPQTSSIVEKMAGELPAPRVARYAALRDPGSGELLDRCIVLYFPAPTSATGEDYAEFQIHGGRAVVEGVLASLARQSGLRPADPGEFVRRGFINGKLDLSQAEALADLIEAQTEAQRRQALRLAGGALRRKVEHWRELLIEALSLVEAELDFSDEADVDVFDRRRLDPLLATICDEIAVALQDNPASERMRDGFRVMILGPPNAGKSTLINALTQRDLAIVSPHAGTTRDMIEAHLDLEGMPVTVVDTAGLRERVIPRGGEQKHQPRQRLSIQFHRPSLAIRSRQNLSAEHGSKKYYPSAACDCNRAPVSFPRGCYRSPWGRTGSKNT